jgi:hypothetical protein
VREESWTGSGEGREGICFSQGPPGKKRKRRLRGWWVGEG